MQHLFCAYHCVHRTAQPVQRRYLSLPQPKTLAQPVQRRYHPLYALVYPRVALFRCMCHMHMPVHVSVSVFLRCICHMHMCDAHLSNVHPAGHACILCLHASYACMLFMHPMAACYSCILLPRSSYTLLHPLTPSYTLLHPLTASTRPTLHLRGESGEGGEGGEREETGRSNSAVLSTINV